MYTAVRCARPDLSAEDYINPSSGELGSTRWWICLIPLFRRQVFAPATAHTSGISVIPCHACMRPSLNFCCASPVIRVACIEKKLCNLSMKIPSLLTLCADQRRELSRFAFDQDVSRRSRNQGMSASRDSQHSRGFSNLEYGGSAVVYSGLSFAFPPAGRQNRAKGGHERAK